MHVSFIPYGKRSEVELLLRDMESQKHILPMTKEKETKVIHIQGQVRLLPFGVVEYLFPKENLDAVLHTLAMKDVAYNLKTWPLGMIRKFLRLKKIPKYKKNLAYIWIKDNVSIIPLGIREDGEIVGSAEHDDGWTHEAL